MKKKLLTIALMIAMIFAMTACGSSDNAELVPEEFDKIIAKYDDRNLRPVTYHIYVNSTAYIGSYNASDKTYTANG